MRARTETALPPFPSRDAADRPAAGSVVRRQRGRDNFNAGLRAEVLAAAALERDGWRVLRRRVRTPAGEIDLVAERIGNGTALLAFVEVKRRRSLRDAAICLSASQAARLLRAGEALLAAEPGWAAHDMRFDLLLVDPSGTVRRIADVLREQN